MIFLTARAPRWSAAAVLTLASMAPGIGSASAPQDNWPRFLGPTGVAVSDNPDLPSSWSRTQNIGWSAEIAGMGWSSPIVWGGRVFVTAATSDTPMKQPSLGVDFSNDYVAELQAQGLSIEEILEKVGDRDTEYPAEIRIRLILYSLDLETGALLWERALHEGPPPVGRHRKNSFASETPVTDGEAVYVYFAHKGLFAYDFDGNELWRMSGLGAMPIPTPITASDLLYLVSGPPGGKAWPMVAVAPGGSGDITLADGATHSDYVAWFDWKGGTYLSTPVLYRGNLYVLQDKGILVKHDALTGEVVWKARIAPGAAAFTASPWAYDGKIFALSEEGDTFVMGAGEKYELIGTNSLDEFSMATPAIVGNRLLLRTQHHLWSIRRQPVDQHTSAAR